MATDGELAEVARYAVRRLRIFLLRVAEITDNRFQIQSFAAGEIVPGLQALDAVSNGTVEMGNTALNHYSGKNPAFTFGTALPFGLNTRQQISWLLSKTNLNEVEGKAPQKKALTYCSVPSAPRRAAVATLLSMSAVPIMLA